MYIIYMLKFFVFSLLINTVVNAKKPQWKKVKSDSEIYIYELKKENYDLKHFKAQTIINQDIDTLLAVLQDTEACSIWVFNCIKSEMVNMIDVRQRIYHTVIHSPLWFKDRDFYLQSNASYDPNQRLINISLESKPNFSNKIKGFVRVDEVEMRWVLKYLDKNMTLVTYQVYIEPKLPIKVINNKFILKSVFKTMQGLTKIVDDPKYHQVKYTESELEMLIDD